MLVDWTSADNERRRCPRQTVGSLVYVDLGQDNGGIVYNLGGGGLAITTLAPLVSNQVIYLGLELETNLRIEASGQVAWTSETGKQAGVRFVDLPDRSCQQIKEWLTLHIPSGAVQEDIATPPEAEGAEQLKSSSTGRETQGQILWEYEQAAKLRSAATQARRLPQPELGRQIISGTTVVGSRRRMGLLLGVTVVLGAVFVLGYVVGGRQHRPQVSTTKPANEEPTRPAKDSGLPATTEPTASRSNSSLNPPLIPRGAILLQVAALTHEQDAWAMAEALRQKKFPALVLTPNASPYYHVQVGPYADTKSAAITKRALEREGFKVIVKRR